MPDIYMLFELVPGGVHLQDGAKDRGCLCPQLCYPVEGFLGAAAAWDAWHTWWLRMGRHLQPRDLNLLQV